MNLTIIFGNINNLFIYLNNLENLNILKDFVV